MYVASVYIKHHTYNINTHKRNKKQKTKEEQEEEVEEEKTTTEKQQTKRNKKQMGAKLYIRHKPATECLKKQAAH